MWSAEKQDMGALDKTSERLKDPRYEEGWQAEMALVRETIASKYLGIYWPHGALGPLFA